MSEQLLGRADASRGPSLGQRRPRRFVGSPNIGPARLVLAEDLMMGERIAEELEPILATALCFGLIRMHRKACHHRDIGVDGMTDRHAFGLDDMVIIIDPLLRLGRIHEDESQGTDPQPRRESDGLAVGACHPHRRMGFLYGFGTILRHGIEKY